MNRQLPCPAKADQAEAVQVTWQTPIGAMIGLITPGGIRELMFPEFPDLPPGQMTRMSVKVSRVVSPSDGASVRADPTTQSHIESVGTFLKRYFKRRPINLCPRADWAGYSPFLIRCWEATQSIGFGRTTTYGELAQAVGRPAAARAVGQAMARNPVVLITPCHRVLPAGGSADAPGKFTGGPEIKGFLLRLETRRA